MHVTQRPYGENMLQPLPDTKPVERQFSVLKSSLFNSGMGRGKREGRGFIDGVELPTARVVNLNSHRAQWIVFIELGGQG